MIGYENTEERVMAKTDGREAGCQDRSKFKLKVCFSLGLKCT